MRLLGLAGEAGQGKDWHFRQILQPRGWRRWAFAEPLKLDLWAREICSYEELYERKTERARTIMQVYATEIVRGQDPSFWVKLTGAWLTRLRQEGYYTDKICITDVRFDNEAEFIRTMGGKVVQVPTERPTELTEAQQAHSSEQGVSPHLIDAVLSPEVRLVDCLTRWEWDDA